MITLELHNDMYRHLSSTLGETLSSSNHADVPDKRKVQVQNILHEGHHLLELVESVLDFSGAQDGNLSIKREEFEPWPIVEESVSEWKLKTEAKVLTFTLNYRANASVKVTLKRLSERLGQLTK